MNTATEISTMSAQKGLTVVSEDTSKPLSEQFCSMFGITSYDSAVNLLNNSFFKSLIEKEVMIKQTDIYNVMNIAVKSKLNPFNNELYPLVTPFGLIKILATVDGWMRIGQRNQIESCNFTYSETKVNVINAFGEQTAHEWIECEVHHAQRGKIRIREYMTECMNDETRHLPSWNRPNRQLRHIAMIQCYRVLLPVAGLSDDEIISDLHQIVKQASLESHSTLAQGSDVLPKPINSAGGNTGELNTKLNINVDKIEIDEEEVDTNELEIAESESESEEQTDTEQPKPTTVQAVNSTRMTPESNTVDGELGKNSTEIEQGKVKVEASEVSPTVVNAFRKMAALRKNGDNRYTIATFEKFRDSVVKKQTDKQWVSQEIAILK